MLNRELLNKRGGERESPLRALFAVMTVPEAAKRFDKHINTVRDAMIRGKLDFRKSEGTFLITTESLIKYFGKPKPADLETVELTLPMWRKE